MAFLSPGGTRARHQDRQILEQFMKKVVLAWLVIAALIGCQRPPANSQGTPQKITVAFTTQPQSTLVQVAVAKGYFLAEGLEVQPLLHTYGKAALQSLLDHKADFATVAETPVMFNLLKGEKFFVIANIEASSRNNAIVARRDAGISGPSSLKGKRIGFTPGTTSDFFLDSMLTALGLTRQAIQPVALKPEEMQAAILERKVDAVCTWNYPLAQIKRQLGANGTIFFDPEIYTETFNITASPEVVEQRPETVRSFLRALIKAERFVAEHPAEAQAIMAVASKMEVQLVREVWDAFNYRVRLGQTLLIALEDETRWAMKNKLTDRTAMPDYRKSIRDEFLWQLNPDAVRLAR
jgi:ABC-type nitrate/sulfonate/bicarbonate transport system substrate-binding protein